MSLLKVTKGHLFHVGSLRVLENVKFISNTNHRHTENIYLIKVVANKYNKHDGFQAAVLFYFDLG